MQFTKSQETTIDAAVHWYKHESEQIFQISGNPGTGKSVVLNEIIRRLGLPIGSVAPMAYTGAASIVMRLKGLPNAKTIHSWLYEPVEVPVLDSNGITVMNTYFNTPLTKLEFKEKDLSNTRLIVIDEAGSVPYSMREHILNSGAKVLVAGDLDQLPPVADKPGFLYTGKVHFLTEIMRQDAGSAIIYLSQRAKTGLPIHTGNYGNVLVIAEDELTDEMIRWSPVILCGKNNTRDRLTTYIRKNVLGHHSNLPEYGEKIICRKNNWNIDVGGINLTNGLTGIVINNPDVSGFDGKLFDLSFVPDILRDICFEHIPVNYEYLNSDKTHRDEMRKFQYLSGNLFEFGYAQTVHLAQGSQWSHGIYMEEYMNPEINNKLNYVGLSRFAQMAIYVKQKRKYL